VQFEEKKFLEAARKTIQTSIEDAGRKLESEHFNKSMPGEKKE